MEFVSGGVICDTCEKCWLDHSDDATSLGTVLARFHMQPSFWYEKYAHTLQDTVFDAQKPFPEYHPYSFLSWYLGDGVDAVEELVRAIPLADVQRYGDSCLEIVGCAMGLRRALQVCDGRWRSEQVSQLELDKWCKLMDFLITFTPKAYELLSPNSLMGRVVIGHGDLHSKNILRRKASVRGNLVLVDYDRVHRLPAAVDFGSTSTYPDDPYPTLSLRRTLATAYLDALDADVASQYSHSALDDVVFDLEKGAVLRALAVPLFLVHKSGLRKNWSDSWSFIGLAQRGFAALSAADADPGLKDAILQKGIKAKLMEVKFANPFLNYKFYENPGAFQAWFPDVEV